MLHRIPRGLAPVGATLAVVDGSLVAHGQAAAAAGSSWLALRHTAPSVKSMTQIFDLLEKYGIVSKGQGSVDAALKELVHPEFVEKVLARKK